MSDIHDNVKAEEPVLPVDVAYNALLDRDYPCL